MESSLIKHLSEHQAMIQSLGRLDGEILCVAELVIKAIKAGKKILIFGNGGSAADAQHFAAELTGRYKRERRGLPAIALTTDTSALTAIGNDYGFEKVFVRQAQALAVCGDVFIGLSTSGNSPNVIHTLRFARDLGCQTIGFTGGNGGQMVSLCDITLTVPSDNTPRIQEGHGLLIHALCEMIEDAFSS